MKNKANVPQIRFAGFTDAWEQRKLGEIADKVIEKNVGLQYIETFTNSAEFGIISQRDFFNHDITKIGSLDGYYIVRSEDFVYNPRISASAPVGPINRNKTSRTGVMSPLYTVFRPHGVDTTYLEYFFKSKYWHSFMNFNGDSGARSDRFSIKDSVFFEMPIPIPYMEEQEIIGKCLSNLDNLITLHQHECDLLDEFKQTCLQKMFPKKGSNVPEIRFTGFSDDWEHRKLGEMGTTYTGLSGKSKSDFGHGDGNYVTYMNVFLNPVANSKTVEPIEIDMKQNEVKFGDVFFTTSSETPEEVGMSSIWLGNSENTYLNSFCFGYRLTERLDPFYLAYMLRSFPIRKRIVLLAQGISRYNVSKNKMMEIRVPVPKLEEQQQIGMYFYNLDCLITLHRHELEELQNIKKTMLEKMFV